MLPMSWRDIETTEGAYAWDVADRQVQWCRDNRLAVCAGPLVQWDARSIPDWLHLCEGEFESLSSFATEFVEAVVRRYRGKVDLWIASGRMNTSEVLSLTEEERIRLAAVAAETTRRCDPDAPVFVSFDQPWGEYLSCQEIDFPPLQFADALLRAGLGITGLALDINLGYWPDGTLPRDLLDFSQQIDRWGYLDVPLLVTLAVPSARRSSIRWPIAAPAARGRMEPGLAAGVGPARTCRCCWPRGACKGSSGTNSATSSRTPFPTAGCSICGATPSRSCGSSSRSGRHTSADAEAPSNKL